MFKCWNVDFQCVNDPKNLPRNIIIFTKFQPGNLPTKHYLGKPAPNRASIFFDSSGYIAIKCVRAIKIGLLILPAPFSTTLCEVLTGMWQSMQLLTIAGPTWLAILQKLWLASLWQPVQYCEYVFTVLSWVSCI